MAWRRTASKNSLLDANCKKKANLQNLSCDNYSSIPHPELEFEVGVGLNFKYHALITWMFFSSFVFLSLTMRENREMQHCNLTYCRNVHLAVPARRRHASGPWLETLYCRVSLLELLKKYHFQGANSVDYEDYVESTIQLLTNNIYVSDF